MPPTMTTRSAGRSTAAPRGGGMGGQAGRGGGRTRGEQWNQNGDAIDENIQGNVRNVIVNNDRRGCTYKELLACNPKEYDGKGGAIVYTRWIKKMESVQDMSGCGDNQKVKYTAGLFVGKALTWFHELARLIPHLVTPENKRIERNGSLKKNTEKRDNGRETSRDRNLKGDNKRTRIGNAFATIANPMRREYMGTEPKFMNYNLHHSPESHCRACFNCNRPVHLAKDCRVVPRMVNPMNARNSTATRGACFECGGTYHFKATCPRLNKAQRPEGGHANQVVAIGGGQGLGNNGNKVRRGAFMLGTEEARQDPNIVTGTFILNNHYATTLFDSGADYSFVSTSMTLLLGIESINLGFSYKIEMLAGS
ncbi:putative reverse transcriptase domain-containing protein [Tanacetum coccineum]